MLKMSYTPHLTNEQVLTKITEKQSMFQRITEQQKLWIGHNLRHPENLLTIAIEGRFLGKRDRGRKRCSFLDVLKEGDEYSTLKRRANDRQAWRSWKSRTCHFS